MPTKLLAAYEKASRIPIVGRGAFSLAFAMRVPYFLTITPTILELRPNHAEVKVRKWWGTHNHLGTLHVIAVAETDPDDWSEPGEVPVRVHAVRRDGTTVVEGVIRLHTSLRK